MEASIEKPVCTWAEQDGWVVRKVKWIGRVAAMDRLFLKGGRIVFIEFKDTDKDATLIQSREHERFRQAGAEVHVVNTLKDGCRILGLQWPRPS